MIVCVNKTQNSPKKISFFCSGSEEDIRLKYVIKVIFNDNLYDENHENYQYSFIFYFREKWT